jgi:hypothetical protein
LESCTPANGIRVRGASTNGIRALCNGNNAGELHANGIRVRGAAAAAQNRPSSGAVFDAAVQAAR